MYDFEEALEVLERALALSRHELLAVALARVTPAPRYLRDGAGQVLLPNELQTSGVDQRPIELEQVKQEQPEPGVDSMGRPRPPFWLDIGAQAIAEVGDGLGRDVIPKL